MTPDLRLSQVKITPRHLERKAVISMRQSSLKQVREHLDSQRTQRTLIRRAAHLGWHPERIEVFDGDLGQSAAGMQERDDLKALAAEVALVVDQSSIDGSDCCQLSVIVLVTES